MKAFKRQRKSQINERFIHDIGGWIYQVGKLKILSLVILFLSASLIFSIAYDSHVQYPEASEVKKQNEIYTSSSVEPVKVVKVASLDELTKLPTAGVVDAMAPEFSLEAEASESKVIPVSTEATVVEEEKKPTVNDYSFDKTGYTTTKLKVRKKPSTDSKELNILPFNEEIKYSKLEDNDEWYVINYKDKLAYVCAEYISDKKLNYETYSVSGDRRKSFMDHSTITYVDSPQYDLKKLAYTADNGVRAVNGRYLIALGSFYSHNVGQYIDVVLENGTVIECIVGDCKRDCDTMNGHTLGVDGGAVEFIVQTSALNQKSRNMGDVSYTCKAWHSNVVELRIYEKDIITRT